MRRNRNGGGDASPGGSSGDAPGVKRSLSPFSHKFVVYGGLAFCIFLLFSNLVYFYSLLYSPGQMDPICRHSMLKNIPKVEGEMDETSTGSHGGQCEVNVGAFQDFIFSEGIIPLSPAPDFSNKVSERPETAFRHPAYDPHSYSPNVTTVLMWDNPFGMPFYWGTKTVNTPNYAGYRIEKKPCPHECRIIRDRSAYPYADAVIFDVCYYGTDSEWKMRPPELPERYPGMQWGWYTYEQRYYFTLMNEREYLDRMDFKVNYEFDAEVQITYMCPWGSKEFSNLLDPPPPKSDERLVAFMASNCGTGGARERTAYVRELMKYIQVDSFGHCLHNADIPEGTGWHTSFGGMMDLKMRTLGQYKFFLAFENNDQVDDYVTEKMINALFAGTVPVYRGAPTIYRWLPDPSAIIDVSKFDSPHALAQHLLEVASDETRYQAHFAWKRAGSFPPGFQRLLDNCVFDADCRICEYVREKKEAWIAEQQSHAAAPGGPAIPDLFAPREWGDVSYEELPNAAQAAAARQWRVARRLSRPGGEPLVEGFAIELNSLETRAHLSDDAITVSGPGGSSGSPSLDVRHAVTLMAWVQTDRFHDGRIFDKNRAGTFDGFFLDIYAMGDGTGVLRFCGAGNCYWGRQRMMRGLWYHVAATFEGAKGDGVRLYLNGKLDAVHSPNAPELATNVYSPRVGQAALDGWAWRPVHKAGALQGKIDDLSMWNCSLPQRYVWKSMFRNLEAIETTDEFRGNLVLYYSFNRLSWITSETGAITGVRDMSGNGHHGLMKGNVQFVPSITKPLTQLSPKIVANFDEN